VIRLPPQVPGETAPLRAASERGSPGGREPMPHFVLKRGHRGRYRFSFRTPLGGITGEVFVSPEAGGRADHESQARLLIARLTRALLDALEHQTSPPPR
jgi:hypothetical protein